MLAKERPDHDNRDKQHIPSSEMAGHYRLVVVVFLEIEVGWSCVQGESNVCIVIVL